ncbi:hypothetical protein DFH11DRAFT_1551316 [Phellopilus nigrolimitatus]|nr:hypothetical protein DFH11DRAFT_1551316 [Phellopilus nigrolimitatus]
MARTGSTIIRKLSTTPRTGSTILAKHPQRIYNNQEIIYNASDRIYNNQKIIYNGPDRIYNNQKIIYNGSDRIYNARKIFTGDPQLSENCLTILHPQEEAWMLATVSRAGEVTYRTLNMPHAIRAKLEFYSGALYFSTEESVVIQYFD